MASPSVTCRAVEVNPENIGTVGQLLPQEDSGARWLLGGVVALTLLNSGVSVAFSYIGRDFWTALSNKDPAQFNIMLQRCVKGLGKDAVDGCFLSSSVVALG